MERALLCPGYPVGTPTAMSSPTLQKSGLADDSLGFPGSSAGKESACNAGDFHLIPGSGRFSWRRDRLPSPVSWASLVAQMGKNLPVMWETWV